MHRFAGYCALVLTALIAVLIVPTTASAATPTRIMALGDSITGSPGCAFGAGPPPARSQPCSRSGSGALLPGRQRPNVALGALNAPKAAFGASNAPKVAFGALNAPNVAFGALNATKATLGRLGATCGWRAKRSSASAPVAEAATNGPGGDHAEPAEASIFRRTVHSGPAIRRQAANRP